ncbi:MAG: transposase [Thermodesulfobacteriota bacterium]
MREYQSLAHVRWECKFHIVWVPKYRKKRLYGKVRRRFGESIKDLCRQKGVDFIETVYYLFIVVNIMKAVIV